MEINTGQLRLGNLFIDRKGQICKVERIEKKFEECKILSETGLTHLPVKPIPLTEEVLLKCGFKLDYESTYTKIYELEMSGSYFIYKYSIEAGLHRLVWGSKVIECKYLHKLQNIIEDLTEKELTYNH